MPKRLLDFSSAYAQLILLVFLPITVLASVGAYLVEQESHKATISEQRTLATAALIRYEPLITQQLPVILATHQQASTTASQSAFSVLDDVQNRISNILASMDNDQHVERIAIVSEQGDILVSSGPDHTPFWITTPHLLNPSSVKDTASNLSSSQPASSQSVALSKEQPSAGFIAGIPTIQGTAYGHFLGDYVINGTMSNNVNGQRREAQGMRTQGLWLFVEMDNEPLTIARLRIWLGLGLTGLFTLLLLLLSLNIYAKRWIVPIYNLRLHLQSLTPDTLYRPMHTQSTGELNQLQQDLAKVLRRLYGDFQELKDHAAQTESDLRDAFDDMEMQNIFIREARDHAISSSRTKSAFLANISHELRTPLNSIDGFINLLARHGDLSAEQELYVQTIRKSSAHLLALVNDVLDFSKIEAGKLVLDTHVFDLYAAIYDVVDMLSPLAAEKGLRMAVVYYNDVPTTIVGDELRVKQILTNLVANAIKFTDVGDVVVRISLDEPDDTIGQQVEQRESLVTHTPNQKSDMQDGEQTPIPMETIHIAIEDSGQGISDDVKAQLFTSFGQGDPSITRQYGGTGLGLVISRQLTRLMGGDIGFYNNSSSPSVGHNQAAQDSNTFGQQLSADSGAVKTGATFWFSLPVPVIDAETDHGSSKQDNLTDIATGETSRQSSFQLPILRPYETGKTEKPIEMLVWLNHTPSLQVLTAAINPLDIALSQVRSLASTLERLKEEGQRWDWVIIDGGDTLMQTDLMALLKQVRLHYQGYLAVYGYQVSLDISLLKRYKTKGLYQPLDKRQLYQLLDARIKQPLGKPTQPMWQGVTVLAVDDHLPNLLVLEALLRELGIQVVTANSGSEAINIISKQISETHHSMKTPIKNNKDNLGSNMVSHPKIDLIFMDIQMPHMSGSEAAQHIRQLEAQQTENHTGITNKEAALERSYLPIIALTAQSLSEQKQTLIQAGIDDYVGKPISRPQLLQILQRWLGDKRSGQYGKKAANVITKALTPSNLLDATPLEVTQAKSSHWQSTGAYQAMSTNNDTDATLASDRVVDWQDALTRSANKPELAKQLLTMMQASVDGELADLQQAWHNNDRTQLAQVAHRILGASRYTGVPQIRQASQNLEDKCLLNVQYNNPAQMAMLKPYYQGLIKALMALQQLDLNPIIERQREDKALSENDMTWKMI